MEHDEAIRMIRAITTTFDEHDLDGIMAHFADDAVFEAPRGPDPWGRRFVGRDEVRNAFAGRFSGIPDIRYQADEHFADGDWGGVGVDALRHHDNRGADRGPRLRPLDVSRWHGRYKGLVLEDQDDRIAEPRTTVRAT